MKFTRQPDQPNAEAPRDRKLHMQLPKTVRARPWNTRILGEDGKTVTTIRAVKVSGGRADAMEYIFGGLVFTAIFGALTAWCTTAPSEPVGAGILAMLGFLFFGIGTLAGLWSILIGVFKYLTASD